MPRTDADAMAIYHVPKTDHDPTGPHPFEGTRDKMYPTPTSHWHTWDDTLMHDTPSDCLFDDDPENPQQRRNR